MVLFRNYFYNTPTKIFNLPLEIIPDFNPYGLKYGDSLSVTVLFRGNPLPEAELSWSFPAQGEKFAGTVKTNKGGTNTDLTYI